MQNLSSEARVSYFSGLASQKCRQNRPIIYAEYFLGKISSAVSSRYLATFEEELTLKSTAQVNTDLRVLIRHDFAWSRIFSSGAPKLHESCPRKCFLVVMLPFSGKKSAWAAANGLEKIRIFSACSLRSLTSKGRFRPLEFAQPLLHSEQRLKPWDDRDFHGFSWVFWCIFGILLQLVFCFFPRNWEGSRRDNRSRDTTKSEIQNKQENSCSK